MREELPRCFHCNLELDLAAEVEVILASGEARYFCTHTCVRESAELLGLAEIVGKIVGQYALGHISKQSADDQITLAGMAWGEKRRSHK